MSPPTPHLAVITLSCADRATATDVTTKLMTLAAQLVRGDEYVGSASSELFEIPVGRLPRVSTEE